LLLIRPVWPGPDRNGRRDFTTGRDELGFSERTPSINQISTGRGLGTVNEQPQNPTRRSLDKSSKTSQNLFSRSLSGSITEEF
jgi:hypothetical protein